MCLLILNKAEAPILTADQFHAAWGNNPHGGGLVYNKGGKQIVKKTQKTWETFYGLYLDAREEAPDSHIIVHFRWATHGSKSLDNTHPFKVWNGLYFAHNGVLNNYGHRGEKSDTRDFNDRVLKHMPDKFYLSSDFIQLLADHIGAGNKFVFLDSSNEYGIVNERAGHWKEGNWFSNYSYEKKPSYTYTKDANKVKATAEKLDEKLKRWNKLLSKAIKFGEKTPDYKKFEKEFDAEWAERTKNEIWKPAIDSII